MNVPRLNTNAQKAQKYVGIPAALWIEITKTFRWRTPEIETAFSRDGASSDETAFMAGFVVGWAEAKCHKPGIPPGPAVPRS
jgi:hypothetical protein